MKVLGISDSSVCGGATVAVDGEVIVSINEERLDRNKLSTGFPRLAIGEALRLSGLGAGDIDRIQAADRHNYFKPVSTYWAGWLVDHASKRKERMATFSSAVSSVVGNSTIAQSAYYALKRALTAKRRPMLRDLLAKDFGLTAPLEFIDHHFCHATSAYYTAGHPEATVITLDGGGDGLCSRVYRVKNGEFESLHALRSYHSVGNYYAYVTKLCGFTAHKHEGKITGLAAYGKPKYLEHLRSLLSYRDGNILNTGNAYYWSAVNKLRKLLPDDFAMEDLACSIQKLLEEVTVAYCKHWIERSGVPNVALAGGVFANVRLNQFVHELDCVDNVFVHPGMGDEGLSFGAALTPDTLPGVVPHATVQDVYHGPGYTEDAMERALKARGVKYERLDDVETRIAQLLAKGHVVARFDGRMEYGPRALGDRSILYQPNDPSANDWLNKHLTRTEFMPFAPALPFENAHRCFKNLAGAEETARFMTITFACTEEMARLCPGVTHVDGTARPQLVREKDNPSYYRIMRAYEKITGLPAIVNTSFNVHDEPIVCSPEDALNGFIDGDLDYLAIGSFLAEGKAAHTRTRVLKEGVRTS